MHVSNRLREAFEDVRASEALKERTLAYIARRTRGYRRAAASRALAPALACLALLLLAWGGHGLYFTPTSVISIDVNPSLELSVNRFDRVVGVEGLNEDGRALAGELSLTHRTYADAVEQVLDSPTVASCVAGGGEVSLTVVGEDEGQCSRILAGLETCVGGRKNTSCRMAGLMEVAPAHEAGLSYGKYLLFLQAQALDPGLTAEDVQGMTMKELRLLIEALSPQDGEGGRHGQGGHGKGK